MVSARMKGGLFMGFGAGLVVMGAVMAAYWPPIFLQQLKSMMVLTNESASFEMWRETPIPMYLECFMFNISNVAELLSGADDKLKVVQMGPYVFKESHTKTNLSWNDNNTVTFYNERFWHFQPEMSNGSLSDSITSVNPVIATVGYFMRFQGRVLNTLVDLFLRSQHENLFLTANASSWLFDGIEDPVLNIAANFPNLPIIIPYDKFGWFYERNGSIEYDGSFIMNTGALDFSMLGNVEKWRYSNTTSYRDECGAVRGSTGELWAPEVGQTEAVVFASDICTFLILKEEKVVEVEGLEGVQFASDESLFDNGYRYPHMACYCDEVRDENCLPPGALNVSACRYGAPAFVSLPHFLYSDPYYPSKIEGLNPTSDHNFRLALEMLTGMPLAVSAQLQINLLVRHVTGISMNNHLPDPDTLVPMFWFRQQLMTTTEYADIARQAVRIRYWVPIAFYVLTGLGVLLLVPGVIILVKRMLKSPETSPIVSQEVLDNGTTQ